MSAAPSNIAGNGELPPPACCIGPHRRLLVGATGISRRAAPSGPRAAAGYPPYFTRETLARLGPPLRATPAALRLPAIPFTTRGLRAAREHDRPRAGAALTQPDHLVAGNHDPRRPSASRAAGEELRDGPAGLRPHPGAARTARSPPPASAPPCGRRGAGGARAPCVVNRRPPGADAAFRRHTGGWMRRSGTRGLFPAGRAGLPAGGSALFLPLGRRRRSGRAATSRPSAAGGRGPRRLPRQLAE